MPPSARKHAAALAERLDAVVPPPLRVRADGTRVDLYDGAELWDPCSAASEIVEARDGRTLAELAECASSAVISGVQDCVATALRQPWPTLPGGEMAMPFTRSGGRLVHLWFGSDEHEVVSFPPIVIADLVDAG